MSYWDEMEWLRVASRIGKGGSGEVRAGQSYWVGLDWIGVARHVVSA